MRAIGINDARHAIDEKRMGDSSEGVIGRRRQEVIVFLILAVLLAPIIAVGLVGGYGFSIWMYQTIAGPPGSADSNSLSE